ncbi:hypothetical protein [Pseudonocardia sp. GCM10023141]|uniref:hypothetical protein n=1 Tax=Pseudonocardia sp. GCM10023141 TaxID=3252653 RepID=UPI00361AF2A0
MAAIWAGASAPTTPRRTRRPTIAGVAGGVGTTTVATAIGGIDNGVFTGGPADILVCRASGDSLIRAGKAAQLIAADRHPRPLLIVTATDKAGPCRPVATRLRLLEPHTRALLVAPYVRRWTQLSVPLDEVAGLLDRPLTELPRVLRRYALAMRELCAALTHPVVIPTAPPPRGSSATPTRERKPPSCAL